MFFIQLIIGIDIYGDNDPKFYFTDYEEANKYVAFFIGQGYTVKIGKEDQEA